MIQANKLRTSNLVHYNGMKKEVGKITALAQDTIPALDYCQLDYRVNKKHWLINIEPIPITEEWLSKLGFNRLGYQYFELCNIRICTHEFGWLIIFDGKDLLEIKSVHQLQNLYFSLTNKELKLCQ